MKLSLICFAIVVLGLRGIEWNNNTEIGHGVSKVIYSELTGNNRR